MFEYIFDGVKPQQRYSVNIECWLVRFMVTFYIEYSTSHLYDNVQLS